MSPIPVFFVISYGPTQTRISLDGAKMIEEFHSHSDPMSFRDSYKNTTWISSVERTRSLKMGTSFSQRGNWLHCSVLLITVERWVPAACDWMMELMTVWQCWCDDECGWYSSLLFPSMSPLCYSGVVLMVDPKTRREEGTQVWLRSCWRTAWVNW
jgi:hypothetical protein